MQPPQGFVIWLTGLPASGKTSLAIAIQEQLNQEQVETILLDSDQLRALLTPAPTFSEEERHWFYDVVTNLAAFLANTGCNVLIAATGNLRAYRRPLRLQIAHFAEVYLQCPLPVCRTRDKKGVYAQAEQGVSDYVAGIDVPYEPPFAPEVVVDMNCTLPTVAAASVIRQLRMSGILRGVNYEDARPSPPASTVSTMQH